jgi:imidazolonepropionase-like amidohydrolase
MSDLVLSGAVLIDGTGAGPYPATVTVAGDRIAAVERTGPTESTRVGPAPAAPAPSLDLTGLHLLPGLIDAHSHLGLVSFGEQDRMPLAVQAAHIFRNAGLALECGFTTVRDVGGVDGGLAQAIDLGLVAGPRVLPSGALLCQTGGHGDAGPPFLDRAHHGPVGAPGLTQGAHVCDGPEEVRRAARLQLRYGATQVKVCVSGGVLSRTDRLEDSQFSGDELRAAVEEAAARGTYVTAHAHSVLGIQLGLAAGVSCFEHITFLDPPTAARMADAGAVAVPTLAVMRLLLERHDEWGVPKDMLSRLAGVEEAMARSVKLAHDAGIPLGSGSDILGPAQDRRGLELVLKAELLGPMEAIVSATSVNARILRLDQELGTVEAGKRADLVALDGDPLANPAILDDPDRVVLVMKDGAIVKQTWPRPT